MSFLSVIFDLDGTLLDTLRDLAESSNQVLSELGYAGHEVEQYRNFIGDGLRMLMTRALPQGVATPTIDSACELFADIYAQRWQDNGQPYHGIEEVLTSLENAGLTLAVLSNKPHRFCQAFINRYFPTHSFAVVQGQGPQWPKKPDPQSALMIADTLGAQPAEVCFIGDSGVDMQTAKAAGMYAVGAAWGFRSIKELQQAGADAIALTPLEILKHVRLDSR